MANQQNMHVDGVAAAEAPEVELTDRKFSKTDKPFDRRVAEAHLEALFERAELRDGFILIYNKAPFAAEFFHAADHAHAAAYACERSVAADVYLLTNLIAEPAIGAIKARRGRGREAELQSVVALVSEIDAAAGRHKDADYPTQAVALDALSQMPLPPSIVNLSGQRDGGLHVFWLCDSPIDVSDSVKRKGVKEISKGWQGLLKSHLLPARLDSTFDLVRVLRIPGLTNHKYGVPTRPVLVEDRRYQLKDFARHLDLTPKRKVKPCVSIQMSSDERVSRCRRYLQKLPDAISGERRQYKSFQAACECFRFGLSEIDTRHEVEWFNQTKTRPQLEPEQLNRKLADALRAVLEAGEFGMRLER